MAKRQKQIYNSREIAHLWIHQTQESARDRGGDSMHGGHIEKRFYFEGDTIYSYGPHFPIAKIVDKKNKIVLFTTRTRSNTTAKHICRTRRAIPKDYQIIEVYSPDAGFEVNFDHMKRDYDNCVYLIKKAKQCKYERMMALHFCVSNANTYARFCKERKRLKLPKNFDKDLEVAKKVFTDWTAKANERREKQREANRIWWQEQERIRKLNDAEKIEKWRKNEYSGYLGYGSALLRVNGDQCETSKGVKVPLDHAKRVYERVKQCKEANISWQRNGEQIRVGVFQVDTINADGSIIAGCHNIEWSEIEAFAKSQGWIEELVTA